MVLPLYDDGRRCRKCGHRSLIFGDRDPASGWVGWCEVCNSVWHSWYLSRILISCNRDKLAYDLFCILMESVYAARISRFLLRCPVEVLTNRGFDHLFCLIQLPWPSCPLDWWYEATDSEAEEERYWQPTLRTLREVHVSSKSNSILVRMRNPRLLDVVCDFLYCDCARSHTERSYGQIQSVYKHGIFIDCHQAHAEDDWQVFLHGERPWLWRASTEDFFYIDRPPPSTWKRYWCPINHFCWWHNAICAACFREPVILTQGKKANQHKLQHANCHAH